ncbi:MAG: universal stress protein [Candidatus Paracaedimonas acanthamoebae]|uniref:Universal stress protein n=1 Tax=Candidatus Paracaedimonas acanthamoebae TaxID=244581 RepID=A0A8J7TV86_9PROT|nr:universal stress protein [Candidatus Paracaedimonas acanthamoebae]
MIKKIILALDGSKPSLNARDYAIKLAKEHKALLTAIAVLDTPWLTAAQPEPLGGSAFKIYRDEVVIKEAEGHLHELLAQFKLKAEQEDIKAEAYEYEGFPVSEIERASYEGDIIILGKTTDFHFSLEQDNDLTVRHIARDNPRPIIIVPENFKEGKRVIIAYDGSVHASKALHMFLLLGLAKGNEVHVVTVKPTPEQAQETLNQAINLSNLYDVKLKPHVVISDDNPAPHILELISQINPSLIVMGAFSHNILSETLFGSCTKTLMNKTEVPLFINH